MRTIILSLLIGSITLAQDRVLFIRGGDGTGGVVEATNRAERTEQLADIINTSESRGNHGWATLAKTLGANGFELEQALEGPEEKPAPIELDKQNLSHYAIIVFGSNNATYTDAQVDAFWKYIRAGGSALFISDANFGNTWQAAPNSDQKLLARSGVIVNQDHGTYTVERGKADYIAPDHPILKNVGKFDGEGVSPVQMPEKAPDGFTVTQIARAKGKTRINDGSKQGTERDVTPRDSSLLVIEHGHGRVACHFDRNTFFNVNGAGTSIERHDNKRYAINLFGWLARRP